MSVTIEELELDCKTYDVVTLENEHGSWTFAGIEPYDRISEHKDSCMYGGSYGSWFDSEVYYYSEIVDDFLNGKFPEDELVERLINEDSEFKKIFNGA